MFEQIEQFEHQTRNIDLTVIDNGTFYPNYSRLKIEGAEIVRKAKVMEAVDVEEALIEYEKACNIYTEITDMINKTKESVKWAKVRFTTKRILTVLAWIASVIISAIISALFTCEIFSRFV